MKPENAIEVKNVTKHFKVYMDKGGTLKEKLIFWKRNEHEVRQVLKGISFEVKKGEAIGLIGHNGCGKSTTLKLLTKIMYPDSGTIEMCGRVSSLIELGAGFHPDMSGRENIYINASIFGLTKKEIDARLDDIIAFSELEQFIDNPVRTYSSGMYMRLAFSVAINVDADILLIDEILAVGDMNFQAKCFERLKEIKRKGTTIVIVSHALNQIEEICDRSIWIHNGQIACEGTSKSVLKNYTQAMENIWIARKHSLPGENILPDFCSAMAIRIGNKSVIFTNIEMMDLEGNRKGEFKTGESIVIQMEYFTDKPGIECHFGIRIRRPDGITVYGTNTWIEHSAMWYAGQSGVVRVVITDNCLMPESYILDTAIQTKDGTPLDDIQYVTRFSIHSRIGGEGVCRLNTSWEHAPDV